MLIIINLFYTYYFYRLRNLLFNVRIFQVPVYRLTMFNFIKLERAKKGTFEFGDSRNIEGYRIRVRSDLICHTKKDLQHATHPYVMDGQFSQGKTEDQSSSSLQKELFKIE